jgi:hypothetical protein
MATVNPAELMNEPVSSLQEGDLATLSLFRIDPGSNPQKGQPSGFSAVATYVAGELRSKLG